MMVLASWERSINLYVVGKVRRLRSKPASQWRQPARRNKEKAKLRAALDRSLRPNLASPRRRMDHPSFDPPDPMREPPLAYSFSESFFGLSSSLASRSCSRSLYPTGNSNVRSIRGQDQNISSSNPGLLSRFAVFEVPLDVFTQFGIECSHRCTREMCSHTCLSSPSFIAPPEEPLRAGAVGFQEGHRSALCSIIRRSAVQPHFTAPGLIPSTSAVSSIFCSSRFPQDKNLPVNVQAISATATRNASRSSFRSSTSSGDLRQPVNGAGVKSPSCNPIPAGSSIDSSAAPSPFLNRLPLR